MTLYKSVRNKKNKSKESTRKYLLGKPGKVAHELVVYLIVLFFVHLDLEAVEVAVSFPNNLTDLNTGHGARCYLTRGRIGWSKGRGGHCGQRSWVCGQRSWVWAQWGKEGANHDYNVYRGGGVLHGLLMYGADNSKMARQSEILFYSVGKSGKSTKKVKL